MRRLAGAFACLLLSGCVAAPAAVVAPLLVAKGAAMVIAPVVAAHSAQLMAGSAAVEIVANRDALGPSRPAVSEGPGYDW